MGNLYNSFINSKDMGSMLDAGGPVVHYIEDGEGPPLLFLHGLGFSLFTFRMQYPFFLKSFRIIAPDLPGCGYSRLPGNYGGSPRDMANYLKSFLDALNVKQAAVCGAGEGGIYALELALCHPDAVSALVLVSPGSLTRHFPKYIRQLINPVLGDLRMNLMRPEHIYRFLQWCRFNEIAVDNYMVKQVYRPFENHSARRVLLRILQEYDDRFVHDNLVNVRCPTFLVWGGMDAGRPSGIVREYEKAIPGAKAYIIKNCGMLPHEERHKEFNDVVMEFLLSAVPGARPAVEAPAQAPGASGEEGQMTDTGSGKA